MGKWLLQPGRFVFALGLAVALVLVAAGAIAAATPAGDYAKNVFRIGTSGSDVLTGSAGADVLDGRAGHHRVSGLAGDDRLIGGAGSDGLDGGAGNDRLTANDRARDAISCGVGRDNVLADLIDIVSPNCEVVRRS